MISEFHLLSFKSETNEYSNALMMMTSSILLVKWFFTLMWFSTSMPCITCRRHQMHHESESASPQASLNWASQHASFQPLSRLLNPSYDPCPIPGLLASSSAISQRAVGSGQRYQILLHVEQVKKKPLPCENCMKIACISRMAVGFWMQNVWYKSHTKGPSLEGCKVSYWLGCWDCYTIWDITPFNICQHIITYVWKVKGHLCNAK